MCFRFLEAILQSFRVKNHFIDLYVFIDHAADCEVLFNMAPTVCAVNLFNTCNSLNGLVHVVDQKTYQRRSRAYRRPWIR
jgi:hypothetical protein